MNRHKIMIMMAVMLPAGVALGQPSNSIFQRAAQNVQSRNFRGMSSNAGVRPMAGGYGASMYNTSQQASQMPRQMSVRNASWITVSKPRQKDFRLHDLVTIVVHEVSQHKTNTKTDAERDYSISAALTDWIRLSGGNLRPDKQTRGDPQIGLDFEKELKSKAKIERQDTVTARIHAEVIDVLPNGNLVLEATHNVTTDEEVMTITLTGMCRSKDIGVDNSVISTQLANLDLQKHHKGIARDAGKRGIISGFLDLILPF
ncbi:MAG: flagellar basal body L-ring protein FlgH [Planctomycetes bacterium]|nr:flagellar basal body L-ring protein FlgH [Planctomycetota bacterium]